MIQLYIEFGADGMRFIVTDATKLPVMNSIGTIAQVSAQNQGNTYSTTIAAGQHTAVADEPESLGGTDTGANPAEYLCMALASCKAITLRMYIQRKQWNIQNVTVDVSLEKQEIEDSFMNIFHAKISVDESATQEQKDRLIQIAKACPISKLLSKQSTIITNLLT